MCKSDTCVWVFATARDSYIFLYSKTLKFRCLFFIQDAGMAIRFFFLFRPPSWCSQFFCARFRWLYQEVILIHHPIFFHMYASVFLFFVFFFISISVSPPPRFLLFLLVNNEPYNTKIFFSAFTSDAFFILGHTSSLEFDSSGFYIWFLG